MLKFNAFKSKETYKVFKTIIKHFLKEKKPLTLSDLLAIQQPKTSLSGLSEKIDALEELYLIKKKKEGKFVYISLNQETNLFESCSNQEINSILENNKLESLQDLTMLLLTKNKSYVARAIIRVFL